jgi:hypothetical protein
MRASQYSLKEDASLLADVMSSMRVVNLLSA